MKKWWNVPTPNARWDDGFICRVWDWGKPPTTTGGAAQCRDTGAPIFCICGHTNPNEALLLCASGEQCMGARKYHASCVGLINAGGKYISFPLSIIFTLNAWRYVNSFSNNLQIDDIAWSSQNHNGDANGVQTPPQMAFLIMPAVWHIGDCWTRLIETVCAKEMEMAWCPCGA